MVSIYIKRLLLLLVIFTTTSAAGVSLQKIISDGLDRPIGLTHSGDDSGRLFINEQAGKIQIHLPLQQQLLEQPFLDISERVSSGGERGLLGLAFHPDYKNNGYFFLHYSAAGTSCNAKKGDTVISRFRVSTPESSVADPDSEICLLTVHQPYSNHNGGQISFGPDGYLYIGLGDGGSAGDPLNNAQNGSTLLGKILRIDVDAGEPYSIPADNPFINEKDFRKEIWSLGIRNPWRFSFDRKSGDLWFADVGQNKWEEVNVQPVSSSGGENYGWPCREGHHLFSKDKPGCPLESAIEPVIEYGHDPECSVTGGYRYRGVRVPEISGSYVYGDYCSGTVWAARPDKSGWQSDVVYQGGFGLTSFGEDEYGELYMIINNTIYRFESSVQ